MNLKKKKKKMEKIRSKSLGAASASFKFISPWHVPSKVFFYEYANDIDLRANTIFPMWRLYFLVNFLDFDTYLNWTMNGNNMLPMWLLWQNSKFWLELKWTQFSCVFHFAKISKYSLRKKFITIELCIIRNKCVTITNRVSLISYYLRCSVNLSNRFPWF